MLLYLLACGCPTFAETRIVDVDHAASEAELSAVERAIADLEAWTGLAGVCVAELRLSDGVEVNREGDTYDVDGFYGGRVIHVDIESIDLRTTVIHEYCHALDHQGALSSSNPDLFPAESVEESASYRSDTIRRSEALARACQRGPVDTTLLDAIADTCGYAPYDAQQRFLMEQVYREAGHAEIGEPARLVTHRRRLSGIEEDHYVADTGFVDGRWWWWMVKLRRGTDEVIGSALWEVDPVASRRGQVVSLDPALGIGRFIQAEQGVHLSFPGRDHAWEGEVDLQSGAVTRHLRVPWSFVPSGVWQGDTLYVSDVGPSDDIMRLDGGALVDLSPDMVGEGLDFNALELWPRGSGVMAVSAWSPGFHGELLELDASGERRTALPLGVYTVAPFVGSERQLFTVGDLGWVPVLREGDTWRLPEDPCAPLTSSVRLTPVAPNRWISLDGYDEERQMVYTEIELLE